MALAIRYVQDFRLVLDDFGIILESFRLHFEALGASHGVPGGVLGVYWRHFGRQRVPKSLFGGKMEAPGLQNRFKMGPKSLQK